MKISDAVQYLEADDVTTINSMISKVGLNGEATVDQLVAAYPHTNLSVTRDERLALIRLAHKRPNKFAPKLNFDARCEILALYTNGISREVLAKMYAIDRRTVTHVCTTNSPHYKSVREEAIGLGKAQFEEKYLTPDLLTRAAAFIAANKKEGPTNNAHAKSKAGVHIVRGPMCNYDHRVVIKWCEPDGDIDVAGWYYMDLDSDFPDKWFRVGNESMKTSQACYNAMLTDITDKMEDMINKS